MMWVCRAGQKSIYFDTFVSTKRIYLPWEGYNVDLTNYTDREQFRNLVKKEKGDVARTSISNWAGQLYSFCREMDINDYVLIPYLNSQKYMLSQIIGGYEFETDAHSNLCHSRSIRILVNSIPRSIFSQSLLYSLGAYRTVFKIKKEAELLSEIKKYRFNKHL